MTWAEHLISPEDFGTAWRSGTSVVLGGLVDHVRSQWPLLEEGLASLEGATRRWIRVGAEQDAAVALFNNPARLASVIASPTRDAWCPLCVANLPPFEKGITVDDRLVALPNPAPILHNHVVCAHRDHVPQALRPCLPTLSHLMAVADDQTVFLYNGPTSGASSPYHLHLQAGRADGLPLVGQAAGFRPLCARGIEGGQVEAVEAGGRRFLRCSVSDPGRLDPLLGWTLDLLDPQGEFPLNLVLWRHAGMCLGVLFPRRRHRPSWYFLEEDKRIVISPGSVEMAGLVVLPRRQDWTQLDPLTMELIYREVCLDDEAWRSLCSRLSE